MLGGGSDLYGRQRFVWEGCHTIHCVVAGRRGAPRDTDACTHDDVALDATRPEAYIMVQICITVLPLERQISVEVEGRQQVEELRLKIASLTTPLIPADAAVRLSADAPYQALYFAEQLMEDGNPLSVYGIQEGSELKVILRPKSQVVQLDSGFHCSLNFVKPRDHLPARDEPDQEPGYLSLIQQSAIATGDLLATQRRLSFAWACTMRSTEVGETLLCDNDVAAEVGTRIVEPKVVAVWTRGVVQKSLQAVLEIVQDVASDGSESGVKCIVKEASSAAHLRGCAALLVPYSAQAHELEIADIVPSFVHEGGLVISGPAAYFPVIRSLGHKTFNGNSPQRSRYQYNATRWAAALERENVLAQSVDAEGWVWCFESELPPNTETIYRNDRGASVFTFTAGTGRVLFVGPEFTSVSPTWTLLYKQLLVYALQQL